MIARLKKVQRVRCYMQDEPGDILSAIYFVRSVLPQFAAGGPNAIEVVLIVLL